MDVVIREADLGDEADGAALVSIIDSYARGPGGQNAALSEAARERLVPGLREHPMALVLLAVRGEERLGVAVCVWGFSTFSGRPSLNIHDLAVLPEARGNGIGGRLLADAERRARERDASKLTLEVHDANHGAKRLYEAFGFGPWSEPTYFVWKPL